MWLLVDGDCQKRVWVTGSEQIVNYEGALPFLDQVVAHGIQPKSAANWVLQVQLHIHLFM